MLWYMTFHLYFLYFLLLVWVCFFCFFVFGCTLIYVYTIIPQHIVINFSLNNKLSFEAFLIFNILHYFSMHCLWHPVFIAHLSADWALFECSVITCMYLVDTAWDSARLVTLCKERVSGPTTTWGTALILFAQPVKRLCWGFMEEASSSL